MHKAYWVPAPNSGASCTDRPAPMPGDRSARDLRARGDARPAELNVFSCGLSLSGSAGRVSLVLSWRGGSILFPFSHMKYLFRHSVLVLALISLVGGSAWAQTPPRIGTVDLTKIFDGYYKKKQAETIIKDRATELEKTIKELVTKFEKDKAEYDKVVASAGDSNISADERDKRKKQAEDLLKNLKQSDDEITTSKRRAMADLDEQKTRMINRLVDDIREVVSTKARAAGFTLVVDTTAVSAKTGAPIVLYSNNEADITDPVLAQLNAGAPLDLGAPADDKKPDDTKAGKKDDKKKK